ncbi:MAG TPA: hypothetical protein VK002_08520 [Rubricoccaceae bacterium]|nr:hypothetical protein [Rubricoccaceae bacterium]
MRTPPSPPRRPPVTLFCLDGCPGAAALRELFDGLGVPYDEVPLGHPHTPGDACGYTSPSVQITAGSRRSEVLVQPSREAVLAALRGWVPGEPGR